MESSSYKDFKTSRGVNYHYYYSPPSAGKPTILFVHGFPSTSYDWHYQVYYFKNEGYGLIVPDQLGYGGTDKPTDPQEFIRRKLSQDMVDIVDHENAQNVVAVGHDWGSYLVSGLAYFHRERFSAFGFLAVPYMPPSGKLFDFDEITALFEKMVGRGLYGYQQFFCEDGAPELIVSKIDSFDSVIWPEDPQLWKTLMNPVGKLKEYLQEGKTGPRAAYVTEAEATIMKKKIVENGLASPVCWYKQLHFNHTPKDEEGLTDPAKAVLEKPVFFGATLLDYVCLADLGKQMSAPYCKNQKVVDFETDHWVMLAAPDKVNKELREWIDASVSA